MYVVQRRVLEQVLELRLVVGAAVVGHPRVPDRELLEPQHVQHSASNTNRFKNHACIVMFCTQSLSLRQPCRRAFRRTGETRYDKIINK